MTAFTQRALLTKRFYFGDQRDQLARALRALRNSATPENKPIIRWACKDVVSDWYEYETRLLLGLGCKKEMVN